MIAKLGDFGEAKVKGLNMTRLHQSAIMTTNGRQAGGVHVAGTLAYQAPEILLEEVRETLRVAEMYSFGVVVWESLTRKISHYGKQERAIFASVYKKKQMLAVPSKHETSLSENDAAAWTALKKVASACLSRDRSLRPTSSTVVALWHKVELPKKLDAYIPMRKASKEKILKTEQTEVSTPDLRGFGLESSKPASSNDGILQAQIFLRRRWYGLHCMCGYRSWGCIVKKHRRVRCWHWQPC